MKYFKNLALALFMTSAATACKNPPAFNKLVPSIAEKDKITDTIIGFRIVNNRYPGALPPSQKQVLQLEYAEKQHLAKDTIPSNPSGFRVISPKRSSVHILEFHMNISGNPEEKSLLKAADTYSVYSIYPAYN